MSELEGYNFFDGDKIVTTVKLTKSIKELWKNQAKKNKMTMNEYLEVILVNVVSKGMSIDENRNLVDVTKKEVEDDLENEEIKRYILRNQKETNKRLNQVIGFIQEHERKNLSPLFHRLKTVLDKLEDK